jgi:C4-dicarboxylate transporter DctM subunit
VPLFIFAGMAMLKGGAASRLVKFTTTLVGHWPGGLGVAMVIAMGFFCSFLWINFSCNNCCWYNHDAKND